MTPLRQRFIQDMDLAGFCTTTKAVYIQSIQRLVRHYNNTPPERLSEEQVRDYLLYLLDVKKVARGTFQHECAALRFLFYNTLLRDWPLFTKKKFVVPSASASLSPSRTRIAVRSSGPSNIRSIGRVFP